MRRADTACIELQKVEVNNNESLYMYICTPLNYNHILLYFITPKDVKPASTKNEAFQAWPHLQHATFHVCPTRAEALEKPQRAPDFITRAGRRRPQDSWEWQRRP